MKSPITTHVLDTAQGHPAQGISVMLEKLDNNKTWQSVARGETNSDGRITDWMPEGKKAEAGYYRVTFIVEPYLKSQGQETVFYAEIPVMFHLADPASHYHIPLLLSPYGYSTYRGS